MKKLKCIIDTWNMIEKYNIDGWIQKNDHLILIPESEYKKLLNAVTNKKYIKNLTIE